jgi:hypothetical protein
VTVTVELAVPVFPAASVALNVTVVVPRGKTLGALLVGVKAPLTSSSAVALARKDAIEPCVFGVPAASTAATVIGEGGVTTGGVVSVLGQGLELEEAVDVLRLPSGPWRVQTRLDPSITTSKAPTS